MIQQFKYGRREYWARALAEAAIPAFQHAFPMPNGVLIPMPLHNRRFSHRGFNQAESLAREISRLSGWPVLQDLCIRSLHTPRQSQLNAVARRRNLAFAFECRGPIPDCPVVIIDDVITTGSTIDALTNTLLQAGVREVDVFGFARANRRINPEIGTEESPALLVKDSPVRAIFRRATPPEPGKQ
jgi:ComF family protein